MPLKRSLLNKIKKQTKTLEKTHCLRCKGTTSGDICGICGSPLTRKGIEILTKERQFEKEIDEEEKGNLVLFSPKDQSFIEAAVSYEKLLQLLKEFFTIYNAIVTPFGPEIIIIKPKDMKKLLQFEQNELFIANNIRVTFKQKQLAHIDERLIEVGFLYWPEDKARTHFSLSDEKWKIILMVITLSSIILTGWSYYRKIYHLFNLSQGLFRSVFSFTFCLFALLTTHEIIHLFLQRGKKAKLSLPYFIPLPTIPGFLSFFMLGTAGGVIRVRKPFRKKEELFDQFFFPPLVGFCFSLTCYLLGAAFPLIQERNAFPPEVIEEASKIIFFEPVILIKTFIDWFAKVTTIAPPFDRTTQISFLHPIAYAGLIGIIINGVNFLPGAILDGGYFFRCFINATWSKIFSFLTAILIMFNYSTWILGILLLFIPLSHFESPITNEAIRIHWSRYVLLALGLVFGLSSVPIPVFIFK